MNRSFGGLVAAGAALTLPAALMLTTVTGPAAAVERSRIVTVAQTEMNDGDRNVERPAGSNCNYYTGVFRTWKSSSGCGSGDGVQFRNSDWCADFVKYVWRQAGVPHADVAETSGGVLTGWASSFRDYGTRHGTWHTRSSGYTPQPGDAVVFDWDQSGDIDHVGVVTSANGSTVYTIEGNSGNRTKANSYARGNVDIVGYSSPVGAVTVPDEADDTTGEAVDFDGDRKPDLLGTTADGTLRLYRGTGTAGRPSVDGGTTIGSGWNGINRITVADIDNDGKTDLVGRDTDGGLRAYLNQGNADFSAPPVTIGTGWHIITRVVTGDFNNDNKTDLLGQTSDGTLYAYLNTGSPGAPNITTRVLVGTGWNVITRLLVADIDNDGKTDLVGQATDGALYAYLNTGAPNFANRVPIGTGWNTVGLVSTTDIDGDRKTDLLARASDGNLYAYLNKGTTGAPDITTTRQIGTGWHTINRLTLADMDNDGRTDITARFTDGTLNTYLAKGNAGAPDITTTHTIGSGWHTITRLAVVN
ncbi:FG-GAP-like repeat-containing protein [Nonomuraea sp. NPDC048826]|uniref:FG-GAP-like repeat-containing protein n=1 Tax=Nonomuraea sp. NPDC048826 TaxID=3364347 RepID=UPI00371EE104